MAKALGSLAKFLDKKIIEKITQMLVEILNDEKTTATARAGASQSLSEVICALGVKTFES
jgi:hypothetical protein